MMKTSCLIFLAAMAMAVSWSQVDAFSRNYHHRKDLFPAKRQITSEELLRESDELAKVSLEARDLLAREYLARLLLSNLDPENSDQVDKLTLELNKAAEKNWDSIGDYVKHITEIYEKVTGHKPDLGSMRE